MCHVPSFFYPSLYHASIRSFFTLQFEMILHLFLVDPLVVGRLPALDLALVEPQGNLLLGGLDGIGTVADVAADVLRDQLSVSEMGD